MSKYQRKKVYSIFSIFFLFLYFSVFGGTLISLSFLHRSLPHKLSTALTVMMVEPKVRLRVRPSYSYCSTFMTNSMIRLTLYDDVRILWLSSKLSSNLFFFTVNYFHEDCMLLQIWMTQSYWKIIINYTMGRMLYWCEKGKIRSAMIVIKPKDEILI